MKNLTLMSLPQLEAARRATCADLRRAQASLEALQAQRTIWATSDTTDAERKVRRLRQTLASLEEQIAWRRNHG